MSRHTYGLPGHPAEHCQKGIPIMEKIYVIVPNYRPTEDGFAALTRQICDRGYTLIVVDDRAPDADVPPTEPPDERMILLHHARHRGARCGCPHRTCPYTGRTASWPILPPEDWEDGHPRPGSALIAIMAASTVFLAEGP